MIIFHFNSGLFSIVSIAQEINFHSHIQAQSQASQIASQAHTEAISHKSLLKISNETINQ